MEFGLNTVDITIMQGDLRVMTGLVKIFLLTEKDEIGQILC